MEKKTFYPCSGISEDALRDKILIIPSVSLANLPQLAVDLIIASRELNRIGYVGSGDTVAPLLGYSDMGEGLVSGGLEAYSRPGCEFVVLQQRSPVLKSRKDQHVDLLHSFITSHAFAGVIILSSLDAANQNDAQLLTPHQLILPPTADRSCLPIPLQELANLPPLSLTIDPSSPSQPSPPSAHNPTHYPPFIPGGGLTRRLLTSLHASSSSSKGISKSSSGGSSSSSTWVQVDLPSGSAHTPRESGSTSVTASQPVPAAADSPAHLTVVAWCVEGDNRSDARALAALLLKALLPDSGVTLRQPASWKGLFGGQTSSGIYSADAELYG
ncbi:hypothetical protein BD324DRAFT_634592 [Kockovaella imperatae]|uniref:Uncharacterized protein n=1 Tax=Kockovaella imperatae TaxID=4999 RepID=A0A1Y1U9J8_9TREE|nr:hypothetical protein BD324DRAFT_634592 [Kockovaella imperatae]ORX34713.1 hypothetical protein BD324DRAFT_634592 [Kockovaella imperatae]